MESENFSLNSKIDRSQQLICPSLDQIQVPTSTLTSYIPSYFSSPCTNSETGRFAGTAHVLPSSLIAAIPSPVSMDELVLRPISDAAELHCLLLTIYQKQGYRQLSDAGCLALIRHLSVDLSSCSAYSSRLYACTVDELRVRRVKVSFREALMILQTAAKRQASNPEEWDRISLAFAYFVWQSAESLHKEWVALPELLAWLRDVSSMPYGGTAVALKASFGEVLDRISDVYAKEMSLDDILTCCLSCQKYQVNGEGWNTFIKQMELAAQQASPPADAAVKLLYVLATANRLDPLSAQRLIAMVHGKPLSADLHQMWVEVLYFAESEHLLSEQKRYGHPYQPEGLQIAGVLEQIRPGVYRQFPIGPYVVSACYRDIRVAVEVVGPAERVHPGKQSLRSRYIENEYYTIVQVDRDEWRARSESQRFDYLNSLLSVPLRQGQDDVWSSSVNSSKGLGLHISEQALADDVEQESCENAESMIALLRHGWLSAKDGERVFSSVLHSVQKLDPAGTDEQYLPVREMLFHQLRQFSHEVLSSKANKGAVSGLVLSVYRGWIERGVDDELRDHQFLLERYGGKGHLIRCACEIAERGTLPTVSITWLIHNFMSTDLASIQSVLCRGVRSGLESAGMDRMDSTLSRLLEMKFLSLHQLVEWLEDISATDSPDHLKRMFEVISWLVLSRTRLKTLPRELIPRLVTLVDRPLQASVVDGDLLQRVVLILMEKELEGRDIRQLDSTQAQVLANRLLLAKWSHPSSALTMTPRIQGIVQALLAPLSASSNSSHWQLWRMLRSGFNLTPSVNMVVVLAEKWAGIGKPGMAICTLKNHVSMIRGGHLIKRLNAVLMSCAGIFSDRGKWSCAMSALRLVEQVDPEESMRMSECWLRTLGEGFYEGQLGLTTVSQTLTRHVVPMINKPMLSQQGNPLLTTLCHRLLDKHSEESAWMALDLMRIYKIRQTEVWDRWWRSAATHPGSVLEGWKVMQQMCHMTLSGTEMQISEVYRLAWEAVVTLPTGQLEIVCREDPNLMDALLEIVSPAVKSRMALHALKALTRVWLSFSEEEKKRKLVPMARLWIACDFELLDSEFISQLFPIAESFEGTEDFLRICSLHGLMMDEHLGVRLLIRVVRYQLRIADRMSSEWNGKFLSMCFLAGRTGHNLKIGSHGLKDFVQLLSSGIRSIDIDSKVKDHVGLGLMRYLVIQARLSSSTLAKCEWLEMFILAVREMGSTCSIDQFEMITEYSQVILDLQAPPDSAQERLRCREITLQFVDLFFPETLPAEWSRKMRATAATFSLAIMRGLARGFDSSQRLQMEPVVHIILARRALAFAVKAPNDPIIDRVLSQIKGLTARCVAMTTLMSIEALSQADENRQETLDEVVRFSKLVQMYMPPMHFKAFSAHLDGIMEWMESASSSSSQPRQATAYQEYLEQYALIPTEELLRSADLSMGKISSELYRLTSLFGSKSVAREEITNRDGVLCRLLSKLNLQSVQERGLPATTLIELVRSLEKLHGWLKESSDLADQVQVVIGELVDYVCRSKTGDDLITIERLCRIAPKGHLSALGKALWKSECPVAGFLIYANPQAAGISIAPAKEISETVNSLWSRGHDQLVDLAVSREGCVAIGDRLTRHLTWARMMLKYCPGVTVLVKDRNGRVVSSKVQQWFTLWSSINAYVLRQIKDLDNAVDNVRAVHGYYRMQRAALGAFFDVVKDKLTMTCMVTQWNDILQRPDAIGDVWKTTSDYHCEEVLYWDEYLRKAVRALPVVSPPVSPAPKSGNRRNRRR